MVVTTTLPMPLTRWGRGFPEGNLAVMAAVEGALPQVALSANGEARDELPSFGVSASAAMAGILLGVRDELVEMVPTAVTGIFIDRHGEFSHESEDNPEDPPRALGKDGRGGSRLPSVFVSFTAVIVRMPGQCFNQDSRSRSSVG